MHIPLEFDGLLLVRPHCLPYMKLKFSLTHSLTNTKGMTKEVMIHLRCDW